MKQIVILCVITMWLVTIANARAHHGVIGDSVFNHPLALATTLQGNNDDVVKNRKQATMLVKQAYDARVISVVSANMNGNSGYKVKLLSNDGTVFYVFVEAKTGRMIRT